MLLLLRLMSGLLPLYMLAPIEDDSPFPLKELLLRGRTDRRELTIGEAEYEL
jgi:hypothetical protein